MKPASGTPAWAALASHRKAMDKGEPGGRAMRALFTADPHRFKRFSFEAGPVFLDFSKQRVTGETMKLLIDLAHAAELPGRVQAMFAGARINTTENRAAFHVALRHQGRTPMTVDGADVMADVRDVLARMRVFVELVLSGRWRGATSLALTHVVNIGIGGSDLGPRLVADALAVPGTGLKARFVANVDGADLARALDGLNPATTLFVIASKTFTTAETMRNAASAREWLVKAMGPEAVSRHFVAVSTNAEAVAKFGIAAEAMFPFWDWVGGRYSLWSSIGLAAALAIGWKNFTALLTGANEMDAHFQTAPVERNMPALMGLLEIWNTNFWGAESFALLPYDQRLALMPAWLQQLDMESNGKSVTTEGRPVTSATGPIVWGAPGTNGQHAFFQLLHQGTRLVACDFVAALKADHGLAGHHAMLVANCFAQSEAMMRGLTEDEARATGPGPLAPHRAMPGGRPSNTLLVDRLDARALGALLALYEHRTFVQGTIWGINSFDQWGVELGKKLAGAVELALAGKGTGQDSSTAGLIQRWRTAQDPS